MTLHGKTRACCYGFAALDGFLLGLAHLNPLVGLVVLLACVVITNVTITWLVKPESMQLHITYRRTDETTRGAP